MGSKAATSSGEMKARVSRRTSASKPHLDNGSSGNTRTADASESASTHDADGAKPARTPARGGRARTATGSHAPTAQALAAPSPATSSEVWTQPFSYAEIKEGVSGARLAAAFEAGSIRRSDVEMVIPPRTLARRINEGQELKIGEADAVVRLARVRAHADDAFGNADLADRWLRAGNPELNGERPIEMARTDVGAREVEDVLTRFEHGVFG